MISTKPHHCKECVFHSYHKPYKNQVLFFNQLFWYYSSKTNPLGFAIQWIVFWRVEWHILLALLTTSLWVVKILSSREMTVKKLWGVHSLLSLLDILSLVNVSNVQNVQVFKTRMFQVLSDILNEVSVFSEKLTQRDSLHRSYLHRCLHLCLPLQTPESKHETHRVLFSSS